MSQSLSALIIVLVLVGWEIFKVIKSLLNDDKKIDSSNYVTRENFRVLQLENRKINNEYFLLRTEFDSFKEREFIKLQEECRNCQKNLSEKYVLCIKFTEERIRLENLIYKLEKEHREDMDIIYKRYKEELSEIHERIDELVKLFYEDQG